jgi:hypothetical protein
MTKSIFPGNYVNRMSSWQGQGVLALPGRIYFSVIGYALITATPATSWDIRIPSPDMRQDDKTRVDIPSLILPAGANVYSVGLRVPNMAKERGLAPAFSGLVGTNTERLKVADAVGNDNNITASVVATSSAAVAVAGGTIAPVATRRQIITPVALSGAETLRVFLTAADGTTGSSNSLTSTVAGGTPIIVEANYFLDDDLPDVEDVRIPFRVEN